MMFSTLTLGFVAVLGAQVFGQDCPDTPVQVYEEGGASTDYEKIDDSNYSDTCYRVITGLSAVENLARGCADGESIVNDFDELEALRNYGLSEGTRVVWTSAVVVDNATYRLPDSDEDITSKIPGEDAVIDYEAGQECIEYQWMPNFGYAKFSNKRTCDELCPMICKVDRCAPGYTWIVSTEYPDGSCYRPTGNDLLNCTTEETVVTDQETITEVQTSFEETKICQLVYESSP